MTVEDVTRTCWCGAKTAVRMGRFEDTGLPRSRTTAQAVLVRCGGCGVLALEPQPTDQELVEAYSAEYYGATGKKFSGPIASFVGVFQDGRARRVARRISPGARVLDVGCGNGGFLLGLKRHGYAVEGTEWSAESARRIPADAGIPVHVGDLLDVELPARSYDAITIWHVLEHVRRPYDTLAKIRSLLRPGGWLFLAVPNAESAQAKRYGLNWFHHDPPRHLFGFGPSSLSPLLEKVGFRVDTTTTFSFEQNPFGEIQSWLNARRSSPRDRLYDRLKGVEPLLSGLPELARMAALLLPAVVRSTVESFRNEGACLAIEAQVP